MNDLSYRPANALRRRPAKGRRFFCCPPSRRNRRPFSIGAPKSRTEKRFSKTIQTRDGEGGPGREQFPNICNHLGTGAPVRGVGKKIYYKIKEKGAPFRGRFFRRGRGCHRGGSETETRGRARSFRAGKNARRAAPPGPEQLKRKREKG